MHASNAPQQVEGKHILKQNYIPQQTKQDLILACNNNLLACKLMREFCSHHKASAMGGASTDCELYSMLEKLPRFAGRSVSHCHCHA
jgi:hypothetical protein